MRSRNRSLDGNGGTKLRRAQRRKAKAVHGDLRDDGVPQLPPAGPPCDKGQGQGLGQGQGQGLGQGQAQGQRTIPEVLSLAAAKAMKDSNLTLTLTLTLS